MQRGDGHPRPKVYASMFYRDHQIREQKIKQRWKNQTLLESSLDDGETRN